MPIHSLTLIPAKLWLLLAAGPVLFLLGIVAVSVVPGLRGVPQARIPDTVTGLMPHILLGVLVCLALLMLTLTPQIKTAWQPPALNKAVADIFVGGIAGIMLALAYIYWLAPLLDTLQRTIGDYVPTGAVLPAVSSSLGVFFIANVLLAPLVEETLYRGIALPVFTAHLGPIAATALVCLCFGLLHWAGGFWYMLLTGAVAGGLFAGLYYWRAGILAPFAAHLALNLVEFVYAWRTQHQG